jgi:pyrimidine operon attenuation protein/uracil phosphoribosyltransferase
MSEQQQQTPHIELPQYENESAQAYEARVTYVMLGVNRTIAKTAEKLNKHVSQFGRWSMNHGWVECARQYDEMVLNLELQRRTAQYRMQVSEHRDKAMVIGDELISHGRIMAREIVQRMHKMNYRPSDLATAAKAILYGMDMRAHALELDRIIEQEATGDYFE